MVVSAVKGTSCIGTQFSSPLYSFSTVENYVGTIGQVDLRTTEGDYYNGLEITSCDPSSMIGKHIYFPDRVNLSLVFNEI